MLSIVIRDGNEHVSTFRSSDDGLSLGVHVLGWRGLEHAWFRSKASDETGTVKWASAAIGMNGAKKCAKA